MNTQLNKYGLVQLNENEYKNINGGSRLPLGKLRKYGKKAWDWLSNLDAVNQMRQGYRECNEV